MLTMAAMTLALAPQAGASGVEGDDSAPSIDRRSAYGWTPTSDVEANGIHRCTVLVRTADDWQGVEITAPNDSALLPLVSRSELVARPQVGPDGIEIATIAPRNSEPCDLRVQACVHPADHQLIQVGSTFVLVGPPQLPTLRREAVTAMRDGVFALPRLARRDGFWTAVKSEAFDTPSPKSNLSLVAVTAPNARGLTIDEPSWLALAGPLAEALRSPRADEDEARLRNGIQVRRAPRIDQAFLAVASTPSLPIELVPIGRSRIDIPGHVANLNTSAWDLDECVLDIGRFGPIGAPEGSTVTYVVTIEESARLRSLTNPIDRRPTAEPESVVLPLHDAFTWSGRDTGPVHLEGPDEQLDIRPTMGPGAAWGDVDLDGWNDLYLVQGGGREGSPVPPNRTFANVPAGTTRGFDDATDRWGGADTGAGMGALFLDADGDRDLDLFVANYGADVLFDNRMADGVPNLVDVSATAGVGGDLWSAGICAGDVDNDGDLDLYVTSYLEYDESQMPSLEDLPYQREDPVAMLPFAFPGQRNVLLINESTADGLHFVDRAKEWRVVDEAGRGMQPVMFDLDRDGWLDLYVANDVSPNVLYKNNGDGRFRDVSFATGMDDPRGGMGVALGDVDLDGDEDLFLTNWELEANALYTSNLLSHASQRHRVATFRDTIVQSGLGPHGIGVTSWAAVLFDLENDGDLDLYVANGYTSPDYESTGICVGQPDHLFTNDGRGRFTIAHEQIAPFAANGGRDLPSRCAIDCDFDRDGDVDLFVTANNSAYRLLENWAERKGHWLGVRLAAPAPNTFAVGARVEVVTDRRTFVRTLLAGSGYLGGNAPELHFGLGTCERLERVVVHPPGTITAGDGPASPVTFTPADTEDLALDRWVTLDLR